MTAIAIAGCSPAPAPQPSPTPAFASEAEAFAAAEETYRAYNDAVNADRAGLQPSSPRTYLTGLALESDYETSRLLDEDQLSIHGDGVVSSFVGQEFDEDATPNIATASVCMDVSRTQLLDASGDDVTPASRRDRINLDVAFVAAGGTFLIAESTASETSAC